LAVNPDHTLTLAFLTALLAATGVRLWLDARQIRHVLQHRHSVPAPFASKVPLSAHQKAADYTVARTRLHSVTTVLGAMMLLAWTLLGGLQAINVVLRDALLPWAGPMSYQLVLLATFIAIGSLVELPASLYSTFVLEQRFGFNRMTAAMWWADAVKGLVVGIAIGLPLAALMLYLMAQTGPWWWLWVWLAWMVFQVLMLLIYPTFIAPWFNKFEPLADETLRSRVQTLMARCGFESKGLFVMDGSRRSAHGNAYFTGLGAAKRVVFFDTLLSRLTHPEVEAVLAHELGHFHHKHILRRTVLMMVLAFLAFALLGWLANAPWFYTALGVTPNLTGPNDAMALMLFMLVLPPFLFFVGPLMSRQSRRDEFQADTYASQQASATDLSNALLKLYEDNAGTLTPDPLYVAFYASHPPAGQRLAALAAQAMQAVQSVPEPARPMAV
jgi:STE24 endopeptidase